MFFSSFRLVTSGDLQIIRLRRPESREKRGTIIKQPVVYILASRKNGTLYTGVTGDLVKRIYEHKQNTVDGFTKKYNVHNIVYYEVYRDIEEAILRERQMKKWNRKWKIKLIEERNPEWNDLYDEII